jgi:hypothetical protein
MSAPQLGSDNGLGALWNFNAPSISDFTGASNAAVSDLDGVWESGSSADGLQSAFALKWPANERNMAKTGVNPSIQFTVPLARFQFQLERGLTIAHMSWAFLTGPGRDKSSTNVALCTLPVMNRILRTGQLTHAARAKLYIDTGEKGIRYGRRVRGFADGTLFAHDPTRGKFNDGPNDDIRPDPSAILRGMFTAFGVIQDTTGIGPQHSGSATRQPRSSVTLDGSVQTFHIWGTCMPGTRLFMAVARISRAYLGGDSETIPLVMAKDPILATVDYGENNHGVFAATADERHSYPYVFIPCWSKDGRHGQDVIDHRFQFHPLHAKAIKEAQFANPGDAIAYLSIGVLIHPPQKQVRQVLQEHAIYSAKALSELPLSTIAYAPALV